jgi:predicted NBD/HSP70 family sugar kinase
MIDRSEARILALVAYSQGVSRTDLQAQLDLPATTVNSAVGRLLRRGEIAEVADDTKRSRTGRRPARLHLAAGDRLIGFVSWSWLDSRVRALLTDPGGRELSTWQYGAAGDEPLAEPLTRLAREASDRMIAIGVSVAQPYQQGVGSPNQSQGWPNLAAAPNPEWRLPSAADPARAWSERLGVPVLFENDANLEAVGESVMGAASGETNVVYVKLGDRSIGAGLILDGRLYRGANGFAGELAHVHFADNGKLCICGGRGCLSTSLGASLLESIHETFGAEVTFRDLLARADAGDPGPARILGDVGWMIGGVMANLMTFLNPSVLVVDGALGSAARFVVDGLRESIEHLTSPVAASALQIRAGSLGDRADLFGAIAVAREHALALTY